MKMSIKNLITQPVNTDEWIQVRVGDKLYNVMLEHVSKRASVSTAAPLIDVTKPFDYNDYYVGYTRAIQQSATEGNPVLLMLGMTAISYDTYIRAEVLLDYDPGEIVYYTSKRNIDDYFKSYYTAVWVGYDKSGNPTTLVQDNLGKYYPIGANINGDTVFNV